MIKKNICLLFLLPYLLYAEMSPKAARARDLLEQFDPCIERALKDYQVPGVAIGVVVDGHLVYAKGYGYRDIERQLPMTKETLLPLAI